MPLTLLVSFAGGASAGLTGSAALTALCLTVIKALGFATIAALGTVGTFGLTCAIPVVVLGLSLLILHLYNSKKASDAPPPNVFEDRQKEVMAEQWNKHSQAFITIAFSLIHSPLPPQSNFQKHPVNYLKQFNTVFEEPVLTTAFIYFDKLVASRKVHIDTSNIGEYITVCLSLAVKFHLKYSLVNSWFAKVTGIDKNKFNKLECEILASLDHNISVTPAEITKAQKKFNSLKQSSQK